MGVTKDVMIGMRIEPAMAAAIETGRARQGLRSAGAFCRHAVEVELMRLGIPFRPASPADAPLFREVGELVEVNHVELSASKAAPSSASQFDNRPGLPPGHIRPADNDDDSDELVDLSRRGGRRKPARKLSVGDAKGLNSARKKTKKHS